MAVIGLFALHVLGSLRRRSSNSLLHAIVMAVYTLSYPLVGYIIGLMDRSSWYYYDFAVWAVFLLLLLGNTDSLTACRLDNIDDWKSIYVKHLFKAFLVAYVIVNTIGGRSHRDMEYLWLPLAALFLYVGVFKCYVRIASMRMVSKSYLCKKVKVIAEHMQHNDNLLVPFDPVTMQGYSYIVDGEKYCVAKKQPGRTPWYKEDRMNNNVTTVEQVWQCTGRLLHLGKRGKLLKDMCLSMALSKMLNRRFAGFKLSESHLEKTHDLVFKGLLAGDDDPHERAFRVIEEELAFIHDLYYTRYYYLHQKGRYMALCPPVVMIALSLWLTYVLIRHYEHSLPITIFITVVLASLEVYQLYLYIASGWFKVALIRSYISTPSSQRNGCCLEMIIGHLLRLKPIIQPWKGTLGQYCLLHDLGRRSWFRDCLHYATLGLMDKARNKKKGRKSSVKLSKNVKKAIVESLLLQKLESKIYLTNGVTSLQNNGVHARLAWACEGISTEEGSVTRTILVWHVATTLCWQLDDAAQAKEEVAATTASTLSEYCMHLLAFAPKFLPDHSAISESILEQSIDEAGQRLKGAKTLEQRCKRILMDSSTTTHGGDEAPLVVQGARLARDLMDNIQEPTLRWKVLSDFWAEMMLYVSPSDDSRVHLEALARGGEFVTHLWALLTHAGVLKRGYTGRLDVV